MFENNHTQSRPWLKLQLLHQIYGTIPYQVIEDLSRRFQNVEVFKPEQQSWANKSQAIFKDYHQLLHHGEQVDDRDLCKIMLRAIRSVKGLEFVYQEHSNTNPAARSSATIHAAILAKEYTNREDSFWPKPGSSGGNNGGRHFGGSGGKHYFAGDRGGGGGRGGSSSRKRGGGKSGEKHFTPRHGAYCGCMSCIEYFKNVANSDIKPVLKPHNNDNTSAEDAAKKAVIFKKSFNFTADHIENVDEELYADSCCYHTIIRNKEWIRNFQETRSAHPCKWDQ